MSTATYATAEIAAQKERFALVLEAKRLALAAADKVRHYGGELLGWMRDIARNIAPGAYDKVASAAGWTVGKVSPFVAAAKHGIGKHKVGLIAAIIAHLLTTEKGQRRLHTLMRPFAWLQRKFAAGYQQVTGKIFVKEPTTGLDRARNWVARQMTNLRHSTNKGLWKAQHIALSTFGKVYRNRTAHFAYKTALASTMTYGFTAPVVSTVAVFNPAIAAVIAGGVGTLFALVVLVAANETYFPKEDKVEVEVTPEAVKPEAARPVPTPPKGDAKVRAENDPIVEAMEEVMEPQRPGNRKSRRNQQRAKNTDTSKIRV